MACTSERAHRIGDLAAGRIDAGAAEELLEHVERCAACSAELDLALRLVAAAEHHGSLLAPRPTSRRRRAWTLALAAAAGLLLALGLWLATQGGSSEERLRALARVEPLPAATAVLRAPAPPGADRGPRFERALERYAAGDHAAAAELLAPLVAERPDDALAGLYLGISELAAGDPARARDALERSARGAQGLLRERALWYLAHARLALGEADGALAALAELQALGGDYEPNARAKAAAIREALRR